MSIHKEIRNIFFEENSEIIETKKFAGKIYNIWRGINERCTNQDYSIYENYGGRGIQVCNEWQFYFVSFYNWAIQNGYKPGLTIERINNNGNYEPNNCKWISQTQQSLNRRSSIFITAFGETKTMKEWSKDKRCNCSYTCIRDRIKAGINGEIAITKIPYKKI